MSCLFVPPIAQKALQQGADCAIGVSGGKDSQALLAFLAPWFRSHAFQGRLFAIFADLGRAEWAETPRFVQSLCEQQQIELVVVRRTQGDLLSRFEERMGAVGDKAPFWPSATARYCTSDLKRSPIDRHLRRSPLVLSLEGIRAAESEARASKTPLSLRTSITSKRYRQFPLEEAWQRFGQDQEEQRAEPKQQQLFLDQQAPSTPHPPRLAFTWYPLFTWSLEEVWRACGTSCAERAERRQVYRAGVAEENEAKRQHALDGWPAHPAYLMGANRLSCSLCVLGDSPTLLAGAQQNPDYYRSLCLMEAVSGWSFQPGRWLCDIAPSLLTEEILFLLEQHPRRQVWRAAQALRQSDKRVRTSLPMLT